MASRDARTFIPVVDRWEQKVRTLKRQLEEATERYQEGAKNGPTVKSLAGRLLDAHRRLERERERAALARAVSP